MKFAFGLGGLLILVGVIAFMMRGEADRAKSALDARESVMPQLNQLGGRDENGKAVSESAVLSPQANTANSRIKGLLVSDIVAGGAYEKYFGLKQYDLIIEAESIDLRTQDAAAAKLLVADAYQRSQSIVVERGASRLTLPAAGTPTPGGPSGGLQGQLNTIKIPTH